MKLILNDKINGLTRIMVNYPELIKVVSKSESYFAPDLTVSYHVLYTFAHTFHMSQRGVVRVNEWMGWSRYITSAFQHGNIYEIWKNNIKLEKWFDPDFQKFINDEILHTIKK